MMIQILFASSPGDFQKVTSVLTGRSSPPGQSSFYSVLMQLAVTQLVLGLCSLILSLSHFSFSTFFDFCSLPQVVKTCIVLTGNPIEIRSKSRGKKENRLQTGKNKSCPLHVCALMEPSGQDHLFISESSFLNVAPNVGEVLIKSVLKR